MAEGTINVNSCQQGENVWQCPAEDCRKLLSRKQTLITHVKCFHPELYKQLDTIQSSVYKQYEDDPSKHIPKSTMYWRKRKHSESNNASAIPANTGPDDIPAYTGPEDAASDPGEFDGRNQQPDIMTLPTDEAVRYGDSDMSFSSESDENSDDDLESSSDDSELEDTPHSQLTDTDPPLYVIPSQKNVYISSISKSEHVMAVGAFATRHNLSNAAIGDLLKFVNLHLPTSNMGLTSVKSLKEECGFDKNYLKYNLYCEKCKKLCTGNEEECETPGCSGLNVPESRKYFVTSDISVQLSEIMERPGVWKSIQESHCMAHSQILTDIKSGKDYQKLKEPGGFLSNANNITLSLFTDGIPLFKSSSVSLWPVYILVNELPAKERFQRKNMVLWGIWQGVGKPNMVMFLKPLVKDLIDLYENGFTFSIEDVNVTSRAMLVVATMDLQARAYVLNMTQHNGEYGCLYCLEKGETTKSGAGHCRAYPFRDEPSPLRTETQARASAAAAREKGIRQEGFYGENVFMYLPYFSMTSNIVIDYMHGILLGITKKLLELWFETKYSDKTWYIGDKTKQVDKLLQQIQPPYFIHRRPRAIHKTYHHWKASELRNWLLFYSLPCLKSFLPNVYLVHFSCLVEAAYILLGEGIAREDLERAETLLKAFAKTVSVLYGLNYMSMNIHNVTHLTSLVEKWGPLWGWSCFPFESFNGDIKNTIHGTGNVCKDVFWHLQAEKRIARKVSDLPESSQAKEFMQNMSNSGKLDENKYKNARMCHVVRVEDLKSNLTESEKKGLKEEIGTDKKDDFLSAAKIVRSGFVMYSKNCGKVKRQNSFTIKMTSGAVIEVSRYLVHKSSKQVFASGTLLSATEPVLPNRVPHIQKLERGDAVVVAVEGLSEPLVIVTVNNMSYGAALPNHHEKH